MGCENNAVWVKARAFAVRGVRLYQYLCETHKEFVLSKQLLRSSTSIGANVREAMHAQSRADFISKMNIALKEAGETEYWLDLLTETGYIDKSNIASQSMMNDCQELVKLLMSIVKTSRTNHSESDRPPKQ